MRTRIHTCKLSITHTRIRTQEELSKSSTSNILLSTHNMQLSSQIAQLRSELADAQTDTEQLRRELGRERIAHEESLRRVTRRQENETRRCQALVMSCYACMCFVSDCVYVRCMFVCMRM